MNAQIHPRSEPLALVGSFLAKSHGLYIDGKFVPALSGETFDVINPATGEVFAKAPAGGAADIDLAVKAARRAFDSGTWATMNPSGRRNLMWKLSEAIEKNAEEIATLESLDNGMPISMARFMAAGATECLRYNAGWAGKVTGDTPTIASPNHHVYTLREPVGVVGAITPWNVPLAMEVAKISAAIAAGCTVVLKPAELTPLTAMRLAELIAEVGFPPGVINIVTGFGDPAGKALAVHPEVDKISFTGSTAVGKSIVAAAAGSNLKRVALELGGKSPVIIFPDADLERAIAGAADGIFRNAGQVCVAGSRLYVHKKIFDQVVSGVVDRAKALKVGSGMQPDTQMGPLISQKQLDRVSGYVDSGTQQGAEVAVGGKPMGGKGYFMQPTVLAETNRDMRVVREEIFGPVVCAMPIDDEDLDQVVRVANDTEYGLSSSIWTRDISLAHKLARRIRAGTVRVNGGMGLDYAMPFGGYKQSGWGRENGREGVEAYTEVKSVSVAL